MKVSVRDREEARDTLAGVFGPDSVAYTVLRHVSSSGMTRDISVIVRDSEDDFMWNVSYYVGVLLGLPVRDAMGARAVRVSGGGMDMGFHLVYSLSAVLFDGDGYQIDQRWL